MSLLASTLADALSDVAGMSDRLAKLEAKTRTVLTELKVLCFESNYLQGKLESVGVITSEIEDPYTKEIFEAVDGGNFVFLRFLLRISGASHLKVTSSRLSEYSTQVGKIVALNELESLVLSGELLDAILRKLPEKFSPLDFEFLGMTKDEKKAYQEKLLVEKKAAADAALQKKAATEAKKRPPPESVEEMEKNAKMRSRMSELGAVLKSGGVQRQASTGKASGGVQRQASVGKASGGVQRQASVGKVSAVQEQPLERQPSSAPLRRQLAAAEQNIVDLTTERDDLKEKYDDLKEKNARLVATIVNLRKQQGVAPVRSNRFTNDSEGTEEAAAEEPEEEEEFSEEIKFFAEAAHASLGSLNDKFTESLRPELV